MWVLFLCLRLRRRRHSAREENILPAGLDDGPCGQRWTGLLVLKYPIDKKRTADKRPRKSRPRSKMKYVYFDASSGLSGDMILGALLDLGADPDVFKKAMARLKLPVRIEVREAKRSSLRGLQVDVTVRAQEVRGKDLDRRGKDDRTEPLLARRQGRRPEDLQAAVRGRSPSARLPLPLRASP